MLRAAHPPSTSRADEHHRAPGRAVRNCHDLDRHDPSQIDPRDRDQSDLGHLFPILVDQHRRGQPCQAHRNHYRVRLDRRHQGENRLQEIPVRRATLHGRAIAANESAR